MENSKLKQEIIDNINDLHTERIYQVLDFVLFLKHRQTSDSFGFAEKSWEKNRELLLEFGEGLFDGSDVPNDTASNHDKYLYGK